MSHTYTVTIVPLTIIVPLFYAEYGYNVIYISFICTNQLSLSLPTVLTPLQITQNPAV